MKKIKMKNRIIIFIILAVCAGFTAYALFRNITAQFTDDKPVHAGKIPKRSVVHLYFFDKESDFLASEERVVEHSDDPSLFGKTIIGALVAGPGKGLVRTVPEKTRVLAFYVSDGIVYVDLSKEVSTNHPGGCRSELMTIYSLVNSLVLNIPGIDSIKILIEGRESETLAGHIDLRFPFKADMLLVR